MFEAFRDTCLEHYSLDPAHFYTSPGLAWKACLKKTGVRLEVLTDPDMLLTFERGIRGGITQAVHHYAMVNNKYMGDKFQPKKEIHLPTIPRCKQSIWMANVTIASNWRI